MVDDEEGLYVEYNLECKICINTYKLFYVENTEDSLFRKHSACTHQQNQEPNPAVQRRFNRWWRTEWEMLGNGPVDAANASFRHAFSLD